MGYMERLKQKLAEEHLYELHRVYKEAGTTFIPKCSCGWVGRETVSTFLAANQKLDHTDQVRDGGNVKDQIWMPEPVWR